MGPHAAYFFIQVGLSTTEAFTFNIALYGAGIVGTVCSWVLMRVLGRRTLYCWGVALCSLTLTFLVAGTVGFSPKTRAMGWMQGSLIVLVTFFYDLTVGPAYYALVSEIPSSRLRLRTIVVARVAYTIVNLALNVVVAKSLAPHDWNLKGKICLLWAGCGGLMWVWCWFRLPEPKGLTYVELDMLFEHRAPARKFGVLQVTLQEHGRFSTRKRGSTSA